MKIIADEGDRMVAESFCLSLFAVAFSSDLRKLLHLMKMSICPEASILVGCLFVSQHWFS